ncbi:transcriptional regulator [Streptomyces sp. KO7888]|uniref:LCP family protein n=1 Tax=Streptomyces TaxID=1883 RepID=UPI0013F696D2|nr:MULTISPECIES: LCP family protein [Streptomyces]MDI6520424.1 LCP family protein [Streptomyces coelicoflavus]NHI09246.1 transcriptional regulator [Streptomyces sp. KO7888]
MDAQGRGQAEDIDPADQWVLNPDTGDYELRLPSSAPQSPVPGPRRATPAPEREVPAPRRRRAKPEEPPPGRRDRRRPAKKKAKKKSRGKKILLWTGGTMAFVILAVGTAGYLYLQHLNDNIESLPDDGASTGGFQKDQAINILLIGTDKRTGSGNDGYGDKGSAGHADTTLLLHVSKDRSNATALSIPRDLIVDIPDCPTTQEDGSTKVIAGSSGVRFNQSLGQSGRTPSCTMRTVTELTGVKPDNFMVADFNAVKTLSSAVGGVEVCLAKDIDDPDSHLNLPAGKHTIEGEEALAFVRTRHSVGFGGDLSRIELQQQFLSSLMRKLKSNDTLTSPTKMVKLAEAATEALTVDSKLDSIGKLKDLGMELGKLDTKNLTFATVPVIDNPAEPKPVTVVLKEGPAQQVFDMVKNDISFTEVKKKEKEKKKKEDAAVAARLEGEKSEPSEVRVRVLNGGASAGSAGRELTYLQNEAGVTKSENAGNAPAELARTTLEYAPDQADQARALAEILGLSGAAMKPGKSVTNSQGLPTMTLTLGKDFKGAGVKLDATSAKAPEDLQKSTADKVECAK